MRPLLLGEGVRHLLLLVPRRSSLASLRFGGGWRVYPAFEYSTRRHSLSSPVDDAASFLSSLCCGADGRCFCGAGGGERDLDIFGEHERECDSFFGEDERDRLFLRSGEAGLETERDRDRERLGEGDLDEEAEDDENDDDDDEE